MRSSHGCSPLGNAFLSNAGNQLLDELRSMALASPGTKGLFSVLQAALSKAPDRHRVRLNQQVYDAAAVSRCLVDSVATCPTRLQELVPTVPCLGYRSL